MSSNGFEWKKYLIVFLITAGLFISAAYLSNYFNDQKIANLNTIQNNLSIDILSSETQFSLLSELSCKNISDSVFSDQLEELGSKLAWSEKNLGSTDEVTYLQKSYALLQIKDYLLEKSIADRCGVKSAFILYFYTTANNCTLCDQESQVLSDLRDKYPALRVYSFDYSTDLSAVTSMLQIYKIKDTELPALVLDDDVLTGFHTLDDLDARVQKAFKLQTLVTPTKPTTEDATTQTTSR